LALQTKIKTVNEPLGDSLDSATNSKGFSPHRLKSSFCSLSPRNSRRHATPRFEHSSDGENLSKNSFVMTKCQNQFIYPFTIEEISIKPRTENIGIVPSIPGYDLHTHYGVRNRAPRGVGLQAWKRTRHFDIDLVNNGLLL